MAEALYRKYRPQVFSEVVGQDHIERTLKNAVGSDRVSHAYLFTGPRGTGKTTTARLLSKALLCQNGPTSDPCGTCEDCELIAAGVHPDVYELDAASRTGVDNVRDEIIGRVQYAPSRGRFKVYIIDEVHMLSTAAFNALLKTLEEPPSHVVFILCTTDPQKVPETIQSRCQRFDFRRISVENIVSRLGAICVAEGVQFEGEALDLIAQRAEGGMRDALTTLEQLIVYGEGAVTLAEAERLLGALDVDDMAAIVDAIGKRDVAAGFRWTARYVETGADIAQFTADLAQRFRDLYLCAVLGPDAVLDVTEVERRQIAQELTFFGPDRLSYLLGVAGDLQTELRTAANPRLAFEVALTKMARPQSDMTLEALAARVEELERAFARVAQGGVAHVEQVQVAAQGVLPEATQGVPREAVQGVPREAAQEAGQAVPQSAEYSQAEQVQTAPAHTSQSAAAQAAVQATVQSAAPQAHSACDALGAGMVDLTNNAALQRAWRQALAQVKKEKTAYGVLFMNTKVAYDGTQLRLAFSPESEFAFKAVQKPDVGVILERAIRNVFGMDIPFIFVLDRDGAPQARVEQSEPQPQPEPRADITPQPQAQPEPQSAYQPQPEPIAVNAADEVPLDAYEGFYAEQDDDGYYDALMSREEATPAPTQEATRANAAPATAEFAIVEPKSDAPAQEATRANETSAEDAELNQLQETLSFFGNIKIEEI